MKPTETTDTQSQEKKRSGGKIVTKRTPENIKPGEKIITKRKAARKRIKQQPGLRDHKVPYFDIMIFAGLQGTMFPEDIYKPLPELTEEEKGKLVSAAMGGNRGLALDLLSEFDINDFLNMPDFLERSQALQLMDLIPKFRDTVHYKKLMRFRGAFYRLIYLESQIDTLLSKVETTVEKTLLYRYIKKMRARAKDMAPALFVEFIGDLDPITQRHERNIEIEEIEDIFRDLSRIVREMRDTILVIGKALEMSGMLYYSVYNFLMRFLKKSHLDNYRDGEAWEIRFIETGNNLFDYIVGEYNLFQFINDPAAVSDYKETLNRVFNEYLKDIAKYTIKEADLLDAAERLTWI